MTLNELSCGVRLKLKIDEWRRMHKIFSQRLTKLEIWFQFQLMAWTPINYYFQKRYVEFESHFNASIWSENYTIVENCLGFRFSSTVFHGQWTLSCVINSLRCVMCDYYCWSISYLTLTVMIDVSFEWYQCSQGFPAFIVQIWIFRFFLMICIN